MLESINQGLLTLRVQALVVSATTMRIEFLLENDKRIVYMLLIDTTCYFDSYYC